MKCIVDRKFFLSKLLVSLFFLMVICCGGFSQNVLAADIEDWQTGNYYQEGDIVRYEGQLYITVHENPGYNPVISYWYWDEYEDPDQDPESDPGNDDPNADNRAFNDTLNFLYNISGSKTVAGQHNREPNSDPDRWTEQVYRTTGRYPALWSGDFLFQSDNISNRWEMIYEAKEQWENGAIVNIMWHACSPAKSQPCGWDSDGVLSHMSDWEWDQLITNGTPINNRWKQMMDEVSDYLQYLEDNGVEVLFRPLHEMNQGAFWWGGRPGESGTRRLYQITHDYFTHTKGLSNLIWVWNMQDFGSLVNDLNDYNPGNEYWDIASLDVYEGFANWKYQAMVNIAGNKPIAIGETDVLPTSSMLASEPRWAFFMGWAELVFENNSDSKIWDIYNAENVISLDEMPGWNNTPPPPNDSNIAYQKPVTVSTTEDGANVAGNAVDSNENTRWSSRYSDDEWIYVDLGSLYEIDRVRLNWETAYGRAYDIQVSNDALNWETLYRVENGDSGIDDITDINGIGRYVRMHGTQRGTQWGYSLWEFEVYGSVSDGGSFPDDGVQLYQHCDYSGWSVGLNAGSLNAAAIQSAGGVINDASSLKIPAGYQVILYENDNFTGSSVTLDSDIRCLVDYGFNDVMSSMVIRSDSNYPEWQSGQTYHVGDVVLYSEKYYITVHENPGYNPVISHWFWDEYINDTGGDSDNNNNGDVYTNLVNGE